MNQDDVVKLLFFGPTHLNEGEKVADISRWHSPEVLKSQFNYSTKSDVWSFGVLMWECCTLGATPYGNVVSSDLLPRIRNGARPEQVPFIYDDLYQLFLNCWELDASERPSFDDINCYVKQLMTSVKHSLSFDNRDNIVLPYHLPLLEMKWRISLLKAVFSLFYFIFLTRSNIPSKCATLHRNLSFRNIIKFFTQICDYQKFFFKYKILDFS